MVTNNEIGAFYDGKNIFITGGIGFMGKVLLQKLLRSFENIHLYLLLRPKEGLSPSERLEKTFEDCLFETMKKDCPDFMQHITVIEGDISGRSLNIVPDVADMLKEKIDIVIHCAADLSMTRDVKFAIDTNVRGCYELLELCKGMKKLQSLVMVSSTYIGNGMYPLEEKYYDVKISPKLMMAMRDEADGTILGYLKPMLMEGYVNIYSYTKTLSEKVVYDARNDLPVGVFRPGSVTTTYEDPIPGWTDNVYGGLSFMLLILLGLMRVVNIKSCTRANLVPVDYAVNALICTVWDVSKQWPKKKELVYNFTFSDKFTWDNFKDRCINGQKYAFRHTIWAPFVIPCENRVLFKALDLILHKVPMHISDTFLALLNKERRLQKMYRRVDQFNNVLTKYGFDEWDVRCDNWKSVWGQLSNEARAMFAFNIDTVDLDRYFEIMPLGLKKYFLKEKFDDKEADRRWLLRLQLIHKVTKYTLAVLILMLFYSILRLVLKPESYL